MEPLAAVDTQPISYDSSHLVAESSRSIETPKRALNCNPALPANLSPSSTAAIINCPITSANHSFPITRLYHNKSMVSCSTSAYRPTN
jgi:hypothetical protein